MAINVSRRCPRCGEPLLSEVPAAWYAWVSSRREYLEAPGDWFCDQHDDGKKCWYDYELDIIEGSPPVRPVADEPEMTYHPAGREELAASFAASIIGAVVSNGEPLSRQLAEMVAERSVMLADALRRRLAQDEGQQEVRE